MKKLLLGLLFMSAIFINGTAVAQEVEATPLDTLTASVLEMKHDIDVIKRIKTSGYIQTQFQYGDSTGAAQYNGGAFVPGDDKRFMIRRGRVKFVYDTPLNDKGISTSQFVFQVDITEKGISMRDVYGKFTDKWIGWFSITAGMQNNPFGFEVGYSSSSRETPERGRMSQILFPNERDLGAMLTIQGPKTSNWHWLKLEAGMFNGNGAPGVGGNVSDFDKMKNFIGHLTANRSNKAETIKYGLGASYYNGGYRIDTVNVYDFSQDPSGVKGYEIAVNKNDVKPIGIGSRDYTKRNYVGFDGQLNIDWTPGLTVLRAEYIQGHQPATATSTTSINSNTPVTSDIYNRAFNGAYFYFFQNVLHSPWQIVAKYDWYDPNTEIKGDEIGKAVTGSNMKASNATDIKYSTVGVGLTYRWDSSTKLSFYYDMVTNETSNNLSGYTKDLSDNSYTLRMQVKF
ncbi:MAG: porin [Bacteroidetes bacterium]|nr:porin [Bacteroidota bacterium]